MYEPYARVAIYLFFMAIPMLIAGNGSLFYFPSNIRLSSQSIVEFNQRLPWVLWKIYGAYPLDEDQDPSMKKRMKMSGVFQMFLGGGLSVIFIFGQIRDIFWYGDTRQDIIAAVFVLFETVVLVYFLRLGRILVNIERSKQDSMIK